MINQNKLDIEKSRQEFEKEREEQLAQDKDTKEKVDAQMAKERELLEKEKAEWLAARDIA